MFCERPWSRSPNMGDAEFLICSRNFTRRRSCRKLPAHGLRVRRPNSTESMDGRLGLRLCVRGEIYVPGVNHDSGVQNRLQAQFGFRVD